MEDFVTYPTSLSQNTYVINWANHSGHILKQLRLFYGPGGMFEHDVNVVCDGGTVKCHQIILAIGSDYFADIFAEKPLDRTTTVAVVELPKISAKLFRYVYQFMLNGTINLPLAEANLFIKTGQELKVDGLMHFTKGLTTVDATGNTYRAVTISSNLAKIPLNLASTESVGSTQLVKIHKTGPSTSTSASVSNEFESTDKLKRDPQDTIAMDRCVDAETSSFKFVRTSTLLTENVTGVRSNDGDFNDVRPNDPPEQTEMIGGSEESTMLDDMVPRKPRNKNERINEEESKEINSRDVKAQKKSCDKEADQESFKKQTEMDSCDNEAEKESFEKGVELESIENDGEQKSYDNESDNVASVSKSVGKNENVDDDDEDSSSEDDESSNDSDFKGSKPIDRTLASKTVTNKKTNTTAMLVARSKVFGNENRKRKFGPSTSKRLFKRTRRGSILYRGKNYTIKEAKGIDVPCPDCHKYVKLSNLKNHQQKNCKRKKSSEEVSEKMNLDSKELNSGNANTSSKPRENFGESSSSEGD